MRKTRFVWPVVVVLALVAWGLPATGHAQTRGSLGVRVHDVTTGTGVAIDEVIPEGAAAKAGLRAGDVVVEFDGERVRSAQHLTRLVQETAPGRQIGAVILREGNRQTVQLTPDQRSIWPDAQLRDDLRALPNDRLFEMPPPRIRPGSPQIGTTLVPLDEQLAEYFGVRGGVLVSSVAPGSAAAQAGVKAGDVIIAVNGRLVRDPAGVRDALRGSDARGNVDLRVMRDKKEATIRIPASN